MATTVDPTPTHTLVQLSDPHLVAPGQLLKGVVDTAATLSAALAEVERSQLEPAGIILSGDLADVGDPAAYARLREIVEPVAARLGAPVLYGMGNHDDRAAFRSCLLDGDPTDEPVYYTRWIGGLRVIVLDSCVPQRDRGELDADQLDWLAAELAEPAADGTVIVVHHPPLPSHSAVLRLIPLGNPAGLAKVVAGVDVGAGGAGGDVKIIISGHFHHASSGTLAGIPVCVAGSTAYSIDPLAPADVCRGLWGGQYTRLDVYPDGAVATAVTFPSERTLYELGLADFQRDLAAQEAAG